MRRREGVPFRQAERSTESVRTSSTAEGQVRGRWRRWSGLVPHERSGLIAGSENRRRQKGGAGAVPQRVNGGKWQQAEEL